MHYMTDEHVDEIISLTQLEVLEICFHKMPMLNSYIKTQHWQRLCRYCLKTVGQTRPVFDDLYCRKVEWGDHHNLIGGDDSLVLPTNTQELIIYSCHDLRSPSDISSSLKNARELERCWIECCRGLENLWSIPSLEEESESCTYTDTSLLQSLGTLWLSLLNLSVLFNFKGVGVGGAPPRCGTFSNLKLFIVGQCWKLKYVFTRGLVQHHLQNLTVIHVYNCPEMENIIVEEEKQREIVQAKEEDNNAIITCPNLRSLELYNLSKLESIWKGTLISHSLQQIRVRNCPMLKRLPLSLHLNDDPRTPPTQLALKKITGELMWWKKLQWDHPDDKFVLQPLFDTEERLSRYCLKTVGQRALVFADLHCRKVEWSEYNLIGGDDPLVLPTNAQELIIWACHDLSSLSDISSSLKNARKLERCWIDCCRGLENLWSWSIPSVEEVSECCLHLHQHLIITEPKDIVAL
ncbi:hypothetical protein L1049_014646 [Liquidambar formosana]|uniref:Disease resistance protein At4g27190-like leucine-rich repeats domain-containing protein n=1 Tax=Liquidambar formosana TaxID=63359 RepID=A0AAP0RXJ3_LIQFO